MAIKCPKCKADNPDTKQFCGDCGTQLIPVDESQPSFTKTLETPVEEYPRGSTFADRYKIIEKLGTGGMGAVYRAEDTNIGQDIALKLIKSDIASDKKTIERFRNELKTTRMISHRNVCRMFDLAETEGNFYITMEYVSGEDLKSFIRRSGKLDIPKAISIAKEVCEGLSEAHRLGVVHRDLKSNNIMIDNDGNARIMDFGIARSQRTKGITGEGIIIGTPEYMSPEQAEAKEIDHRSDIYSLGVILYEMVTGQLPFEGDTPLSIAMKHKGEIPKNPKELNPQISEEFNVLILKCMEKDKEQRHRTAEDLLSRLIEIEEGIPTAERAIPKRKPITPREITVTLRPRKILIPVVVFVAAIIATVILWRPWSTKEAVITPTGGPSLAVIYFENKSGNTDLDNWRDGLAEMIIADISQSKFLNVLGGDQIFTVLKKLNLHEKEKYSSEDLAEIARKARVTHILRGNLITAGNTFIINTSLNRMDTGEVVSTSSEKGQGEESIPGMVDRITKRIKIDLNLTQAQIASDIDKSVGMITTGSPEAYQNYIEGLKLHYRGRFSESIPFFEKAVALDPDFVMAHRHLGFGYRNLDPPKYKEHLLKALSLSERITERERYRIQGDYYMISDKTWDKAIEAYSRLLELYPEDWIGNNYLGVIYNELEEWEKAQALFKVNVENRVDVRHSYMNLSLVYGVLGKYDEAKNVLEVYINEIEDNLGIHYWLSRVYIHLGDFESALAEADKILLIDPSFNISTRKGEIYIFKGDLEKAEREFQIMLRDGEQRHGGTQYLGALSLLKGKYEDARQHFNEALNLAKNKNNKRRLYEDYFNSAYVHFKSGDFRKALDFCDLAFDNVPDNWYATLREVNVLQLKGLVYVEMNSLIDAEDTAEKMRELINSTLHRKKIRHYQHLKGMIELKRKNLTKAMEYLEAAQKSLPYEGGNLLIDYVQAPFHDSLALAYFRSGDLEKSAEMYEALTHLTYGRLWYGDIYVKSFYMLGKVYDEQGNTAIAIEHYEKFLDLWKDADHGIAEVGDAKERISALRSN